MKLRISVFVFACIVISSTSLHLSAQVAPEQPTAAGILAASPPMGWNSWDGYGTTVKKSDFKANAEWLAKHLQASGWKYVTVDMEWFVTNPTPEGNSKTSFYTMDDYGRYIPAPNRFPSAAGDGGFN